MHWTPKTLKNYADMRFDEIERSVNRRFESIDRATTLRNQQAQTALSRAEDALNARLQTINEFRQAMSDQQNHLAPKAQTDLLFEQMAGRISKLESTVAVQAGKTLGAGMLAAIMVASIGVIGTVVGIVAAVLRI